MIYIRMYALLTLNVTIITFLHIKLLKKQNKKLLFTIGIFTLTGILTHYYYLLYIFPLYFLFLTKYLKEKNYKMGKYYTLTIIVAGILSLIIFPYLIQHIFFGYRGQGAAENLINVKQFSHSIFMQLYNLNYYGFNNILFIILFSILGILIFNKISKNNIKKINKYENNILKIIFVPSLFFFIITSIASPWKNLRYLVPICGLLFIIAIYYLYKLLQTILKEKQCNIIIAILLCCVLLAPVIFKLEPELLYSNRKEIMQKLEGELNLPAVYLYNSQNGGFLSDILAFSVINESYIAKDIEITEEIVENIFKDIDISKGVLIFVNEESEQKIDLITEFLNFTTSEYIQELSSCKVYYIH